MDTNTKTKPAHSIREADVKATIWLNHGEKGDFYNVTLSRTFKDEKDNLKDTNSFGLYDLTKVEMAVRKAQDWIMTQPGE